MVSPAAVFDRRGGDSSPENPLSRARNTGRSLHETYPIGRLVFSEPDGRRCLLGIRQAGNFACLKKGPYSGARGQAPALPLSGGFESRIPGQSGQAQSRRIWRPENPTILGTHIRKRKRSRSARWHIDPREGIGEENTSLLEGTKCGRDNGACVFFFANCYAPFGSGGAQRGHNRRLL